MFLKSVIGIGIHLYMLDYDSNRLGTIEEHFFFFLLKAKRIREETELLFSPELSLLNERNQLLECFSDF